MLSNAYCTSTCVFPSSPIHDTGSSLESHLSSLSSELTADMCQIFTTNGGNDETGQAKMRGMGASYCASSSTATMPKNALHGYNYDDRVALWYRRTQPVLTPYLGKHGQFGQLSSGPARSKNQWAQPVARCHRIMRFPWDLRQFRSFKAPVAAEFGWILSNVLLSK